jgi:predicted Zn-dependent protease
MIACVLAMAVFPANTALAITQKEELEIGRQVQAEIAASGLIFDDPFVSAFYRRVCDRVLKAAGRQPYPYRFSLIRSPALNAFAVPGGHIYLNTGTIESLENEGQMAAILAHEVAHVTSRHFARRSEAARASSLLSLAGLLAGVALAAAGGGGQNTAALGQALILGSTGANIQAMLANSRADETEADSKGRDYMIKAGYNPRDMFGAFKIMNERSYQLVGNVPGYLSTHPGLASRLASTFADQVAAPPAPRDEGFLAVRDRVIALTGGVQRARSYFGRRLESDPADASALNGLGLVEARELNFSAAERHLAKAAELSPGQGRYLSDLGDLALQMRRPEEAVKRFEAARRAGSDNLPATVGLARAYELTGRDREAASMYDQAVKAAGENYPPALEQAGQFFGRYGQQAKGHFLLSNFYVQIGKFRDSLFHCGAAALAPNGLGYKAACEQRARDLEDVMKALGEKPPASPLRR